jgi:hypothetical protein
MYYSLEGLWETTIEGKSVGTASLPGTLDENRIGGRDAGANQWHPDASLGNGDESFNPDAPIATRFTRKYTYEGEAAFTRRVSFAVPEGKRVFFEAERARCLRLLIDGKEVSHFTEGTISTPHIFEVTDYLTGENEFTLLSDNSYPGLPHDAIVYSSAATDETQTNWNGVLGYLRLRVEEPVFVQAVRAYPRGDFLDVKVEISADRDCSGAVRISSPALEGMSAKETGAVKGEAFTELVFEKLPLKKDVKRWDEYEGNLYELTAELTVKASDGESDDEKQTDKKVIAFGVRDFGDDGEGRLAVNGRTIFLRSEANCAEFPETGHPPLSVKEWTEILQMYKAYGINCVRFHSNCPPEAAFYAADEMGMMMQPELSHWNPKNAFESEESFAYYQTELKEIIKTLANHPSFVMLTFGNELWTGTLGHKRMDQMLVQAHELDDTRLYANGSNVHYGTIGCDAESDFYTAQIYFNFPLRGTFAGQSGKQQEGTDGAGEVVAKMDSSDSARMRGYINNQYPNAKTSYDDSMAELRKTYKKPVFNFEVGQFEVLPDFDEMAEFKGVSEPVNFRLIQEKAEKLGLGKVWKQYVEATGELSRIGYREEIEAAMRTKEMSGISLLGLQDFPGQGTALVGMLNSHLQPKNFDFAKPEAFQAFFRDQLPLVYLEKYTYEAGELLTADIHMANFGKTDVTAAPHFELVKEPKKSGTTNNKQAENVLETTAAEVYAEGTLVKVCCPKGKLTQAGRLTIPLADIAEAARFDLTVTVGDVSNTYPVWVYLSVKPSCPQSVYETKVFDDKTKEMLAAGKTVYLSPDADEKHLPSSIQTQFTTDFWSVGTFPDQEGGMGQLIDDTHPVFETFPTETHTNWQWWAMASQRAVILPKPVNAIITEMDSYAYMRPMAQLFECRCGGGKLLFSSMGLQNLQQYPEARALLSSIYRYLDSEKFEPEQKLDEEFITSLVR